MDDFPLPGVLPGDPEERLPRPARVRIHKAYLQGQALRESALSEALFAYECLTPDEKERWDGTNEYLGASRELRSAALESIRVVLRAFWAEFSQLGLSRQELNEIMHEQLEAAFYSLSDLPISTSDKNTFRIELALWAIPSEMPDNIAVPNRSKDKIEDPIAEDRNTAIERYKNECRDAGVRVTDPMIAKAANPNWNDRTQVTWWKRNDPRSTAAADRMIRRVLQEKPHLVKENTAIPPKNRKTQA